RRALGDEHTDPGTHHQPGLRRWWQLRRDVEKRLHRDLQSRQPATVDPRTERAVRIVDGSLVAGHAARGKDDPGGRLLPGARSSWEWWNHRTPAARRDRDDPDGVRRW